MEPEQPELHTIEEWERIREVRECKEGGHRPDEAIVSAEQITPIAMYCKCREIVWLPVTQGQLSQAGALFGTTPPSSSGNTLEDDDS